MKLSTATLPNTRATKAKSKIDNFEDLYEEDALQNIYWNERALFKALPKGGNKVRKMKS